MASFENAFNESIVYLHIVENKKALHDKGRVLLNCIEDRVASLKLTAKLFRHLSIVSPSLENSYRREYR